MRFGLYFLNDPQIQYIDCQVFCFGDHIDQKLGQGTQTGTVLKMKKKINKSLFIHFLHIGHKCVSLSKHAFFLSLLSSHKHYILGWIGLYQLEPTQRGVRLQSQMVFPCFINCNARVLSDSNPSVTI